MISRKLMGGSLAALAGAGAMILAATTAQAAMLPAPAGRYSTPDVQLAWCSVGAHIGPLGACMGGPGYGYGHAGYYGHPDYYGHRGYYGHAAYRHCWANQWGRRVCN